MTDDLDLARAPRLRVGVTRCPACGMTLRVRAGRDLTPEERAAGAWRPQHGPCVRPFITVEDFQAEERVP